MCKTDSDVCTLYCEATCLTKIFDDAMYGCNFKMLENVKALK